MRENSQKIDKNGGHVMDERKFTKIDKNGGHVMDDRKFTKNRQKWGTCYG